MTEELKQPLIKPLESHFSNDHHLVLPEHELHSVLQDIHKTDKSLRGHTKKVTTLAIIGNDFIVSGSKDQRVKVWSLKDHQKVITFRGHTGKVNSVAVGMFLVHHGNLENAEVFSASDDRTVKRWKAHSPSEVTTFIGHSEAVLCLDYDRVTQRLASAGADKQIIIWARERPEIDYFLFEVDPDRIDIKDPRAHENSINCLKFFDCGRKLASGSEDLRVKVWNLEHKSLAYSIEDHDGPVLSIDIFRHIIAVGCRSGSIFIWDNKKPINHFNSKETSEIHSLKFSKSGKFLVSTDSGKFLTIWNLEKHSKEASLFVHNEKVNALHISDDQTFVATASNDNSIGIWQLKRSLELVTLSHHSGPVNCLAISDCLSSFVTGSADRTLRISKNGRHDDRQVLKTFEGEVTCVAVKNRLCIAGCAKGSIKLLHLDSQSHGPEIQDERVPKTVDIDKYGKFAVVGFKALKSDKLGVVKLFTTENLEEISSFEVEKSVNAALIFHNSENSVIVLAGTSNGEVHMCEANSVTRSSRVHELKITSLQVNESKSLLYSGSWDQSIKVLRLSDLSVKSTLLNHSKVNSLSLSLSGKHLAAGLEDGQVKVWNTSEAREDFSLRLHHSPVLSTSFAFKDRFIISASFDSNVKIWATHEKTSQKVLKGLHSRSVTCVTTTPDGKTGLSASEDGELKSWRMSDHEVIAHFAIPCKNRHGSVSVLTIAVSPDGQKVIAGCSDKRIYVFLMENSSDKPFKVLTGHVGEVNVLKVLADNDTVFSCSSDGTLRRWSIEKEDELNVMHASEESVTALSISHSSVYLIVGDSMGRAVMINSLHFSVIFSEKVSNSMISAVLITKDDQLAVISSRDGKIHVWNLNSHSLMYSIQLHKEAINSLALSSCCRYVFTASEDRLIKIWNIQEQYEEIQIKAHSEAVTCIYINPINGLLLSGSRDESISLWMTKDKFAEKRLTGHDRQVFALAVSSNYVVSGSADQKVIIWDYRTLNTVAILNNLNDRVLALSFSDDFQMIFIGLANGEVWSCILPSYDLKIIGKHSEAVSCLIGYKERKVISGSNDQSIVIWDTEKQDSPIFTMKEHRQKVSALAYNGHSELLASGSADKQIILWNLNKMKIKARLAGHNLDIQALAFTQEGDFLVSGSNDKTIKIWNVKEKQLQSFFDTWHPVISLIITRDSQHVLFALANQELQVISLKQHSGSIGFKKLNCTIKALCLGDDEEKLFIANDSPSLIVTDFKNKLRSLGVPSQTYDKFLEDETKSLVPANLNNFQSFLKFYNIFYCLKHQEYSKLSPSSYGVQVSKHNFTFTHFLCYFGQGKILKALIGPEFVLRPDGFGHSAFYYAIRRNDQESVDVLLEFVVGLSLDFTRSAYFTTFYAIQKDYLMIIQNSSQFLPDFLKSLMYEREKTYAQPKESLPITIFSEFQLIPKQTFPLKFIHRDSTSKPSKTFKNLKEKQLKFLTSPLKVPHLNGTAASLSLLQTISDSEDDSIFQTNFIKYYINYKFQSLRWLGYFLALLLITNLLLIIAMISSKDFNFLVFISFLVVNSLLFLWELVQIRAGKIDYFRDPMNAIDGTRLVITGLWVAFEVFFERNVYLTWAMVFVNIFRGFYALRVFEGTRVFSKLLEKSFKNIASFLVVFVFCTVSLGLMVFITSPSDPNHQEKVEITFKNLWMDPFELMLGIREFDSGEVSLAYFGFLFVSVLNWMILMNILIAILADTYDEFLTNREIIDTREKVQLLVEIEQVCYSFARKNDSLNYLHICDEVSRKGRQWKGKLAFIQNLIQKISIAEPVKSSSGLKGLSPDFTSRLEAIEEKVQSSSIKVQNELGKLSRVMKTSAGVDDNHFRASIESFTDRLAAAARDSILIRDAPGTEDLDNKIGEINEVMSENFRQSTIAMKSVKDDMMKISDNLKKKNEHLRKENEFLSKQIEDQLVKNRKKIDDSIKSKIEEKMTTLEMNIQNKINNTIGTIDKRVAETVEDSEVHMKEFINKELADLKEFIRTEIQSE